MKKEKEISFFKFGRILDLSQNFYFLITSKNEIPIES